MAESPDIARITDGTLDHIERAEVKPAPTDRLPIQADAVTQAPPLSGPQTAPADLSEGTKAVLRTTEVFKTIRVCVIVTSVLLGLRMMLGALEALFSEPVWVKLAMYCLTAFFASRGGLAMYLNYRVRIHKLNVSRPAAESNERVKSVARKESRR